jgi:hypothetical protein
MRLNSIPRLAIEPVAYDEPPPRLASLVMQAKLCGLRFSLAEGVFEPLNKEGLGLAITN